MVYTALARRNCSSKKPVLPQLYKPRAAIDICDGENILRACDCALTDRYAVYSRAISGRGSDWFSQLIRLQAVPLCRCRWSAKMPTASALVAKPYLLL
jgi:hypothetical protein